MMPRPGIAVAAMLLAACRAPKGRAAEPAGKQAPAAVLALKVSDTVSVWFTSARTDTSAEGAACTERVMEIRSGAKVIPVPLLYTDEIPEMTTDSTMQVHIWRHCVPADLYRVNLRSGQPTRVGS